MLAHERLVLNFGTLTVLLQSIDLLLVLIVLGFKFGVQTSDPYSQLQCVVTKESKTYDGQE